MDNEDSGSGRAWRGIPYRRRCRILKSAGLGHRPDAEVALEVGLCKATERKYRQRLRRPLTAKALIDALRGRRRDRADEDLAPRLRNLVDRGYSASAIALRLHVPWRRVLRIARDLGLDIV